jgi:hypothetical protein
LLIVQALYQVERDLRDPSFAPYALLPYWPIREHSLEASVTQLRRDFVSASTCAPTTASSV